MSRFKVMTIVGTRPEVIKLSRVIAELEKYTHHILVHTNQNCDYELNQIFFEDLEIKAPDYILGIDNKNPIEAISNVIYKIDAVLLKEQPDAVLFYGDTNSCLAAITAKRRKIPIFHMEAGNRCFDQRTPEEINRKLIDHLSDVNLTVSEHARRYLLSEGLPPDRTFKVGSCMKEVINHYREKINHSQALEELGIVPKNYFLVSLHREENLLCDQNLIELLHSLNQIAIIYKKKIIISTHPRTKQKICELKKTDMGNLKFYKPFNFSSYSKLQTQAFCVLSDSGSLAEDASLLEFNAIILRKSHERPEGMEAGIVVMSNFSLNRITQAIEAVTLNSSANQQSFEIIPDYNTQKVSTKVVRIILSYIDYVNEVVWRAH